MPGVRDFEDGYSPGSQSRRTSSAMSVTENWVRSPVMDAVHFQALSAKPPVIASDRGRARTSWIHSFFHLPLDVAARLEAEAERKMFRRGETIIRRGDRAERLYMIVH